MEVYALNTIRYKSIILPMVFGCGV